jgi:hypothetical protein
MASETELQGKPDIQLFQKRIDQLLRHKNHIIDVLQEENEKLRQKGGGESSSPIPIQHLTEENDVLKRQIQELRLEIARQAEQQAQETVLTPVAVESPAEIEARLTPAIEKRLTPGLEERLTLTIEQRLRAQLARELAADIEKQMRTDLLTPLDAKLDTLSSRDGDVPEIARMARLFSGLTRENAELQQNLTEARQNLVETRQNLVEARQKPVVPAEALAPLQAVIAELQRDKQTLTGQLEALNAQLHEKTARAGEEQKLNQEAFGSLEKTTAEVQAKNREIEMLKSRLGELLVVQNRADESEKALRAKVVNLEEAVTRRNAEIRDYTLRIETSRLNDQEKENACLQLNREIQTLKMALAAKEKAFFQKVGELEQAHLERADITKRLAGEEHLNTEVSLLKDDLERARGKEEQLSGLIKTLRTNMESLNTRFSNFLFGHNDKTISYQLPPMLMESSPEAPLPVTLKLPICFPDRLPPLMKPNWSTLTHTPIVRKEPAKPFRVTRSFNLLQSFLKTSLPAPSHIASGRRSLPFVLSGLKQAHTAPLSLLNLPLHKDLFARYHTLPLSSIIITSAISLQRAIAFQSYDMNLERKTFKILTSSFVLFVSYLEQSMKKSLHAYLRSMRYALEKKRMVVETPPAVMIPVSIKDFRTSREIYQFAHGSKPIQMTPARGVLPAKLPKGGISMLLKGMSDSISSLTSRLDQTLRKAT